MSKNLTNFYWRPKLCLLCSSVHSRIINQCSNLAPSIESIVFLRMSQYNGVLCIYLYLVLLFFIFFGKQSLAIQFVPQKLLFNEWDPHSQNRIDKLINLFILFFNCWKEIQYAVKVLPKMTWQGIQLWYYDTKSILKGYKIKFINK
jgi:hypothetical protein